MIGGHRVKGRGEPFDSVNPANGKINAQIGTASIEEVDLAVSAARTAHMSSDWKWLLPHQRADRLHAVSRIIMQRADAIARVVMQENGKTLRECH
jgi:betaine-aldehyde dehydrogenase